MDYVAVTVTVTRFVTGKFMALPKTLILIMSRSSYYRLTWRIYMYKLLA